MSRCILMYLTIAGLLGWAGCAAAPDPEQTRPRKFKPIDATAATFWDRQTTESADLLRELAAEFNAQRQGLPIKVEHIGGYSDIYRKVAASIQARALPSMAVGYESMTSEYVRSGAVVALDNLLTDPEAGLPLKEIEDFFPVVLDTNRYPDFDNKMYSFPFCKSVLMLYFNKRVLADAGIDEPPRTWEQFLEQCRKVKAKTGKFAYPVSVDCSTVDGMIYSMGGDVVSGRETRFDSPEARRVFELLETLAKEKLAYQIPPGSYDDEVALAQDQVAFVLRSSSGRTALERLMGNRRDKWGMTTIPQADPANPRTVLYGPNICIFDTTPEQKRIAWEFVKFFTSPEVSVRWALGTGYLPIRKSAAEDPALQAFWAQWEYNRAGFDCLAFARTEPNLAGWQEVRGLVENAETAILSGIQSAQDAATDLTRAADAVLARQ
ncbi:MAG TPA: ABC transporter substrate-binding protein [Candidatus Hydrogenedentes bacterium]|nr:ABC transporter substrate-binding protein [Candidatus Hydrogenedentota bacterium]